jgi:5-methylcytosine-specific restriction endonuclease McrA
MSSIPHKRCSKCDAEKPLSEYPYEPKADRYRANCKVCERARYKAWYDQNKAYFKVYAESHRKQQRDAVRRYETTHREQRHRERSLRYARDPEKYRAIARQVRLNDLDKSRAAQRRWYHRDAEHTRSVFSRSRAKNHGKILALNHKRRAVSKGIEGTFSEQEWQTLCKRYGYLCLACGQQKPLTRDHIIPITKEGATNYITNIQPLCGPCNSSKGDRVIDYRPDKDRPQYYQEKLF